jgi:hypothetical protein
MSAIIDIPEIKAPSTQTSTTLPSLETTKSSTQTSTTLPLPSLETTLPLPSLETTLPLPSLEALSTTSSAVGQTLFMKGVAGVGKSTLANIISGSENEFGTGSTPAGVTTKTHTVILPAITGLCNCVTKLIDTVGDSDSIVTREESNHQQVVSLIREDECQTWLYVLRPVGGRISSAAVESYRRMVACFGAQPHSILGVINRDETFPSTADEELKVEKVRIRTELQTALTEYKMNVSEWIYVPDLVLNVQRSEQENTLVTATRLALWQGIGRLRAEHHRVLQERQTAIRLAAEQAILLRRQGEATLANVERLRREQLLVTAEASAATERARVQQLALEEAQRVVIQQQLEAQQRAINQELERQQQAAIIQHQQQEAAKALAAQQEQQRIALAAANAVIRPIKCDAPSCQHYCYTITVGQCVNGNPHWNCKWDIPGARCDEHCPRIKGE